MQFIMNEALECDLSEYAVPRNTTKLDKGQPNVGINYTELIAIEFNNKIEKIELKSEDDCDSDSVKGISENGGLGYCPETDQFINEEIIYDRNRYDLGPEEKPEILSLNSMIKGENEDENQLRSKTDPEFYIKSEEIEIKSEDTNMMCLGGSWNCQNENYKCELYQYDNNQWFYKTSQRWQYRPQFYNQFLRVETIKSNQSEDCNCYEQSGSTKRSRQSKKSAPKEEKRPMYFCPKCPYSSIKNANLKRHMSSHSDNEVHKCSLCPYVTDAKLLFKAHMETHWKLHYDTNTDEYNCNQCSYGTKFNHNFIRHQLKHKKPKEIPKYKCEKCEYETTYKANLTSHMVIHGDPNVPKFKCEKCPYLGKWPYKLKIHMRVHEKCTKKDRERQMYKCSVCAYQTKSRVSLRNHNIAIHTDPSKMPKLKCARCPYQTVLRKSLLSHMSRQHRNKAKDSKMRKCALCFYVTRYRTNLRRHSLVHQEPTFQCYQCDYRTRQKPSLQLHIMNKHTTKDTPRCENVGKKILAVHTDTCKLPKLKCAQCSYETVLRRSLLSHMTRQHGRTTTCGKAKELPIQKCALCCYETRDRSSLQRHSSIHQEPAFQCYQCDYRTRRKYTLRIHIMNMH